MNRHVHDAAALHTRLGTERAAWIDVAGEIPVIARIRVDQASHGAVLECHLWLDAAPAAAIACQDDAALDAAAEISKSVLQIDRNLAAEDLSPQSLSESKR